MKLGVLFSGGKDSVYSAYLAKKAEHELVCLITIISENKDSYMFHTPAIEKTKIQAEVMGLPLMIEKTKGEKEIELEDLERAIFNAKEKYGIEGVVTGAIHSVYQASRIQKICDNLKLECLNPLWRKDEEKYLENLLLDNFKIIVVGVFAYPLTEKWLGRIIDENFIEDVKKLKEKYKIHVAGEGGEFETFVINCPLFSRELKIKSKDVFKEGENSFRLGIEVE